MNLLQIRTEFIERVGRFDLVVDTTDYADNGADKFVNEAINFLNKRLNNELTQATIYLDIEQEDYAKTLEYCRAIKNVWINDDEARTVLTKITKNDFRELYNQPLSAMDQGLPLYYCASFVRASSGSADTVETYMDMIVDAKEETGKTNGIIFGPVADKEYTLEVDGLFSKSQMSRDADYNYWTLNHSDLVVLACQYCLERSYRNTAGARDIYESIMIEIVEVDKDAVEQEIADISWEV